MDQTSGQTGESAAAQVRPLVEFRNVTAALLRDAIGVGDEVTYVAVHTALIIVGTRLGALFQVDHTGTRLQKIVSNSSCVNSLSLDNEGRFCASGNADGRVTVWPVAPGLVGEPWVCEHSTVAVLAVAICPEFASGSPDTQCVCVGGEDGRLVLHKRSLFGGQTLIHEREGAISRLCWRSPLVAWANDRGVKIFSVTTGQKVTYIPRPPGTSTARCLLTWSASNCLVMAWGTSVKVALVLSREMPVAFATASPATAQGLSSAPMAATAEPARASAASGFAGLYAEVRHHFQFEELICGVTAVGDALGVLTVDNRLSLCNITGDVFHVGEVPLQRGALARQLHLATWGSHLPMYVVGPRDLVVFHVRDLLEHSVQLLDKGLYDEAIRLADYGGAGLEGMRHIVCLKCLAPDLRANNFEGACNTMRRFRELEVDTWRECAVLFDYYGGLPDLALLLPVPPAQQLPTELYDDVLGRLVASPPTLVAILSYWPSNIYTVSTLQEKLLEHTKLPEDSQNGFNLSELPPADKCRIEALALLAATAGDTKLAARRLLQLNSSEIFRLFHKSFAAGKAAELVPLIEEMVSKLFTIDYKEACEFFVDQLNYFSVDKVVQGLHGRENLWRHEYLKQVFQKDEVAGQSYHMQMVRLFAEYEPEGLMNFLRKSERYPLEDALAVCQQRGRLEEEAYLLGRSGKVEDALRILLENLQDVGRAVDFVAEYQDHDLWESLVNFVLERPNLLVELLDRLTTLDTMLGEVGTDCRRPQPPPAAHPAHVLRRLPPSTPLPRVASAVQRVFGSLELWQGLHESCRTLSLKEMTARKSALLFTHRRGLAVSPSQYRCEICSGAIAQPPLEPSDAAAPWSQAGTPPVPGIARIDSPASDVAGHEVDLSSSTLRLVHSVCQLRLQVQQEAMMQVQA